MMENKIKSIEVVEDINLNVVLSKLNGKNDSRLGMAQMINALSGCSDYDGYKIVTEENEFYLLISNGQSCCENWGYINSADDLNEFINTNLIDVKFTDVALNTKKIEEVLKYGFDEGGIQFVDFETDKGVLQFAVYNSHNGFYGHDIIFLKDGISILDDVL